MSNKKISQLPAATTPLAGTELVVVVQNAITKQATIDDITATEDVGVSQIAYGDNATGALTSDDHFVNTGSRGTFTSAKDDGAGQTTTISQDTNHVIVQIAGAGGATNAFADDSQFGFTYAGDTNTLAGITVNNYDLKIVNYNTLWYFPHTDATVPSALGTDGAGQLQWTDLRSGTYTPAYSGEVNIDSISNVIDAMWTKIGNIVTVQLSVAVDPTTTLTGTSAQFTLPFDVDGSNIAGQGTFGDDNSFVGSVTVLPTDAQHATLYFKPIITTSALVQFTVTYQSAS